jgi:3-deoxy-7-phosphoheptulonate synthase
MFLIGDIVIGGGKPIVIAGPCAIESREQYFAVAEVVQRHGVRILRGGAYKPRTSPHAFQGLGEAGLALIQEIRQITGLLTVTEAMDTETVEKVCAVCDIVQIGARNMANYSLLKKIGKTGKPVLLKRGYMATIDELVLAAEYLVKEGNNQIILCERGIRTFETRTRNTLDISAVPLLKMLTPHPVFVDPSHSTGRGDLVIPMTRAALAAGADGVMVEVHPNPRKALCDGLQSLDFPTFDLLMKEVESLMPYLTRDGKL